MTKAQLVVILENLEHKVVEKLVDEVLCNKKGLHYTVFVCEKCSTVFVTPGAFYSNSNESNFMYYWNIKKDDWLHYENETCDECIIKGVIE